MTEKQSILVNMPIDKFKRMKNAMKKERQSNQTAFIINAVDAVCEEKERDSEIDRLEKALSILAENARIDREQSARRHAEIMTWLDTLAEAVLGGEEDEIKNFKYVVQQKIQQRRGTN